MFICNPKKIIISLILLVIGVLSFSNITHAAYRDTIQGESNLLYYWPMDQTSGTSLTAAVGSTALTVGGGATVGATGRIDGTAVSFDGTNDYAASASALSLSGYNKVVVEAIVYIPSYTSLARTAWEYGTTINVSSGTFGYTLDGGTNGTTPLANVALFGNAGYNIGLYTRPTAANWHHVVAVYNKGAATSEVDFYVDGVLQAPSSRPFNVNNSNNFGNLTLYLMSRAGSSSFAVGSMQHLAIYSDLSAVRIAAHADLLSTATAVTLSGPTSGSVGVESTNFTVGANATLGSSTIVTPSDGGQGGTFTPTTVTISSGTPTATFTYTPASTGTKTISVTNDQSLSNPSSISYVVTSPATTVTLSGPTSGYSGIASTDFTVGADGEISGTVTVTPNDGGDGGTFTPTTIDISSGTPTATFTYTPASTGTKTISVTNNGGLTNPSSISYTSGAIDYVATVQSESGLLYYWKMDETSGTSLAATVGSTALNVTSATVGSTGRIGNAVTFDGLNDFAVTAAALNMTSYNKVVVEAIISIPTHTTTFRNIWEFGASLGASTGTFAYTSDGGTNGTSAVSNVSLFGNSGYNIGDYSRLTAATWHHVVAVYDKGLSTNEVNLYVDGVLQTPSSRSYNLNNSNNFGNHSLYLMSRAGSSGFGAGSLQHLAIYNDLNSTRIGLHAAMAAAATRVTLAGPVNGVAGAASSNFTVGVDGTLSSSIVVTPSDSSNGGTFNPTTVTLTSGSPTATFTYTPASTGTKTISLTNDSGLTNPSSLSYLATPNVPATEMTLSGPADGIVGFASDDYTVTVNGTLSGSVVVTPDDASAGGTFTPTTITLDGTTLSGTFTYTAAHPGRQLISVTDSGGLSDPAAVSTLIAGSVLALGDSTIATYDGGTQVIDYLFSTDQHNIDWGATSIAVPGHTIAQQKTAYLATGARSTVDATIVQIGLNDVAPAEAASVAIARLQDLITTINSNKKAGSKIIIGTMIPARARLINVYGVTDGETSYQKWLAMNEAIRGSGATPITGVDYRVYRHTDLLNDGSGNLIPSYYSAGNDGIHENNTARTIIGRTWRDGLARIGYTEVAVPSTPTIGTATGGSASASVAFTISDFDGGADVTYTAISTPSSITGTNSSSPISVTGLSETPYTFKVYGTNTAGSSSQSASSNSVTPSAGDITAPTISEVTPVSTPTNDSSPDYTFTTNETSFITYGGSCSSGTTTVTSGSHTITFITLADGTYSDCTITATDASSNASTPLSVTAFTIDATAPTVSSLSPTDNATGVSATENLVIIFNEAVTVNTGNITIKKTSDDTTVETIDVTSGLVTGTGTTTITINPSVTLSSATEYYVQVDSGAFRDTVTNNYAGISSTTAWSFTVADTTNPVVSLTAPSNATVVSGASVTVSASASDNVGVAGVQFKLDGSNLGTEDTSAAYSITWDSTGASDGSHTLSATARDAAGNTATTSSVTVTVDNTAPTRTAGAPSGTLAFGTTTETLSLTTDESATCKYSTNAGTAYGSMTAFDTTAGISHSTALSGLSSGSYTYYVKCSDTQGNVNGSNYSISFDIATDSTSPIVSIIAPTDASTVSGATVTISASASDNDAVVGVQFKVDGTNIGAEDTSSTYGVTWDSTSVSEGAHVISAVVRDTTGNTNTDSINITVDNTAPTRTAGSPSGSVSAGTTSQAISLTTNESATCRYSTTSSTAYGSMTAFSTTGGTSHAKTISGLSDGNTYTYYVKCSDGQGNINATDYTISFDVATDTTPPVISSINASASDTSATITWTTDEDADAQVEYGLSTSYGTTAAATGYETSHSITLTSLIPNTLYHYRVVSVDTSSNSTTSGDYTFTTDAQEAPRSRVSGSSSSLQSINPVVSPIIPVVPKKSDACPVFPRTLKIGMTGNDVANFQKLLGISADGQFGPNTQLAVKKFQSAHGLVADGIAGAQTIAQAKAGGCGTAPIIYAPVIQATSSFTRVLKQGMSGSDVVQLQKLLGITADGQFGPNTALVVKKFQVSHNLTADGVVGPKTIEVLMK